MIGDQDGDAVGTQPADHLLDAVDGDRVDAGEGLVQEHDLGVGDQGPGDLQAASFPAGERQRFCLSQLSDVELLEELIAPAAAGRAIHPQHLHHAQQVLLDGELAEDARLLGEIAHAAVAGAAVHGPAGDVDALEPDLAGVGLDHAAGHAEAGGLAGAVGAQQADDLAAPDLEVDAVDDAADAVDLDQPFHGQHRRGLVGGRLGLNGTGGFEDGLIHGWGAPSPG